MKKIAISVLSVLFVISSMVWASIAGAQDYPTKRLTYIICFNPGGESAITARFQEQPLKRFFGQDVIITYKVGGGGALGWSELVQAKPDGYTIAGHNLPHTILQPMERTMPGTKPWTSNSSIFLSRSASSRPCRPAAPVQRCQRIPAHRRRVRAASGTVDRS